MSQPREVTPRNLWQIPTITPSGYENPLIKKSLFSRFPKAPSAPPIPVLNEAVKHLYSGKPNLLIATTMLGLAGFQFTRAMIPQFRNYIADYEGYLFGH